MLGRKACCLCLMVLCVSVESATECRTREHDVFCAVCLSGAMWAATLAFEPADPGGAPFSRTASGCLSTSCDTSGSKATQFCGISWS